MSGGRTISALAGWILLPRMGSRVKVALYLFQNSFLQRLGEFDHTGKACCGMRRKGFEQNMIDFRFKEALRIELGGQSIQQGSRVVE